MIGRNTLKKQGIKKRLMNKTIGEALQGASFCLEQAGLEEPYTEAEILLSHLMGTDRLQLFLNRAHGMLPVIEAAFNEAVSRRLCGEPSAYITGVKHFYGNQFTVNRNVLIPRPETELIIESALRRVELIQDQPDCRVNCLDLGTGSGILAITLALKLPGAAVWAVDLSEAALETANKNAEALKVKDRICFLQGSYFEALAQIKPQVSFNLIVSNPPYIKKDDLAALSAEVRDYEPIEALNGGEDGLDGYRAILSDLPLYIKTPALLLLEIGAGRQDEVEKLCLSTELFRSIAWRYDLAGHPRIFEGFI